MHFVWSVRFASQVRKTKFPFLNCPVSLVSVSLVSVSPVPPGTRSARPYRRIVRRYAEREKLGLSLAEMSERCGMAREVIYRLESQTTPNPTIGTIQRYATALGLEVSFALKRIAKAVGQEKPNNDAIVAD